MCSTTLCRARPLVKACQEHPERKKEGMHREGQAYYEPCQELLANLRRACLVAVEKDMRGKDITRPSHDGTLPRGEYPMSASTIGARMLAPALLEP